MTAEERIAALRSALASIAAGPAREPRTGAHYREALGQAIYVAQNALTRDDEATE